MQVVATEIKHDIERQLKQWQYKVSLKNYIFLKKVAE
jgi:hypothetical protein